MEIIINAEPPVINEIWEIREKMHFIIGSSRQNSAISDVLIYHWGIKVDGNWVWRNMEKFDKEKIESIPTVDEIRKLAVINTQTWLSAVGERLEKFLEPR